MRRDIGILDAVSYRIPQMVVQMVQFGDGTVFPVCPRCKISIDREYMRFCDRCGQRLMWGIAELVSVAKDG